MGSTYAGVTGPLAFLVVLVRCIIHQSHMIASLQMALVSLVAFSLFGWFIGTVAERVVEEAARSRFQEELIALNESGDETATG